MHLDEIKQWRRVDEDLTSRKLGGQDISSAYYYATLAELIGKTVTVLGRYITLRGTLKLVSTHPSRYIVSNETGSFMFYRGGVRWIDENEDGSPIVVLVGA